MTVRAVSYIVIYQGKETSRPRVISDHTRLQSLYMYEVLEWSTLNGMKIL